MKTMISHGARQLRGLESTQQSTIGAAKFGRMFRWLEPAQAPKSANEQLEIEALSKKIATEMVTKEFEANIKAKKFADGAGGFMPDAPLTIPEDADENDTLAAGYTYFGQFIDHDITFDPASSLQQQNDPDALVDFRTPRLDLDCVYGRGPDDQPYLYEKSTGRRTFKTGGSVGLKGMERKDVPRAHDDHTAIIGDKRNDENKIVTQIQAMFLALHNKIYAKLARRHDDKDTAERFGEAQRITRWCYQWVVLNDYLPRICDVGVYEAITPDVNNHKGPKLSHYGSHGDGYIPVEFAVAAFRFGHSMVRPSYALNQTTKTGSAQFVDKNGVSHDFGRIPIFVIKPNMDDIKPTDAMNGFGQPVPPNWGIDWSFFFGEMKNPPEGQDQLPQPSYRIDSKLVDPLGNLPEFASQGLSGPIASLAHRNLLRGVSMGLPSGQRIARMMGIEPLRDDELWGQIFEGDKQEEWKKGQKLLDDNRKWLEGSAPLWFYILKEAELRSLPAMTSDPVPEPVDDTLENHRKYFTHGRKLGVVGSTIVAETLYGLAWSDHYSFIFQDPKWNPSKENIRGLTANLDALELATFATS